MGLLDRIKGEPTPPKKKETLATSQGLNERVFQAKARQLAEEARARIEQRPVPEADSREELEAVVSGRQSKRQKQAADFLAEEIRRKERERSTSQGET